MSNDKKWIAALNDAQARITALINMLEREAS